MNGGKIFLIKETEMKTKYLEEKSKEIRKKVIEYRAKTNTPHLGSDLSSVEILTTLYYGLNIKSENFIMSKGHACGIYYVILNDLGFIPDLELLKLEEHPTLNKKYGIPATTGSLGHGLSIGLGMALANKKDKIYVLMGDGECDEGQVWEAANSASELKMNNLIGIVDCNGWQGFKKTYHKKLDERFKSFGWEVKRCNGHNCKELFQILRRKSKYPLIILANTVKGKGISHLEDTLKSHYVSK